MSKKQPKSSPDLLTLATLTAPDLILPAAKKERERERERASLLKFKFQFTRRKNAMILLFIPHIHMSIICQSNCNCMLFSIEKQIEN